MSLQGDWSSPFLSPDRRKKEVQFAYYICTVCILTKIFIFFCVTASKAGGKENQGAAKSRREAKAGIAKGGETSQSALAGTALSKDDRDSRRRSDVELLRHGTPRIGGNPARRAPAHIRRQMRESD